MSFPPVTPRPGLVVREFEPADEPALQAVFAAAEDFFVALTGDRALPGDVQSLFYAAPEGVSPDRKQILVIEQDSDVIGVLDAVPGHPVRDAVAIGVFVLHPAHRRTGVGAHVATALLDHCRTEGFRTITVTTPNGWAPGAAFLDHLGFDLSPAATPAATSGNRRTARTESPSRTATLTLPAARPV